MASKRASEQHHHHPVDPEEAAAAFARAIHDGDIVNFRLLFQPFSPAREDSIESFDTAKYDYLLPDSEMEADPRYQEYLEKVKEPAIWDHIQQELAANRPARMPAELVLLLADRAVELGKYTSASLAYEQLRIRQRMQEEFLALADEKLSEGDVKAGVKGYLIGTGLDYNYSAFPEPLPAVPNFQTQALILHGRYPQNPEDCVGMLPPEAHLRRAFEFLLGSADVAARLDEYNLETRLAFFRELVYARDPKWDEFAARMKEAVEMARDMQQRINELMGSGDGTYDGLVEEISSELGDDPRAISAKSLGEDPDTPREWWQYLKDLGYRSPPAVLFVARQFVGNSEIIVPRYVMDSPVAQAAGIDLPKRKA